MHHRTPAIILVALLTTFAARTNAAECGNGLLEDGESCATCAADCKVETCTPTTSPYAVVVGLSAPRDQTVVGATLVLAYRSRLANLPGSGADASVRGRVKDTPAGAIVAANDRDYAVRIVVARAAGIPTGQIASVAFDGCKGTPAPTAADFACLVEGCASAFGDVEDCSCTAAMQR